MNVDVKQMLSTTERVAELDAPFAFRRLYGDKAKVSSTDTREPKYPFPTSQSLGLIMHIMP